MRPSLSDIATVAVAVAALLVGGAAVHRQFFQPNDPNAPRPVTGWAQLRSGARELGSGAKATVVEFADFECPYCATAVSVLDSLQREHPGRLTIGYRYFPLTRIHPAAFKGAEAAECAARQGRFDAAYHALYRHSRVLDTLSWSTIADEAHVPDPNAFQSCMDKDAPRATIERDIALGRSLAVAGTPTFIVDGTLYPAGLNARQLREAIEAALQ